MLVNGRDCFVVTVDWQYRLLADFSSGNRSHFVVSVCPDVSSSSCSQFSSGDFMMSQNKPGSTSPGRCWGGGAALVTSWFCWTTQKHAGCLVKNHMWYKVWQSFS